MSDGLLVDCLINETSGYRFVARLQIHNPPSAGSRGDDDEVVRAYQDYLVVKHFRREKDERTWTMTKLFENHIRRCFLVQSSASISPSG